MQFFIKDFLLIVNFFEDFLLLITSKFIKDLLYKIY